MSIIEIKAAAFANRDNEILEIFKPYGFNLKKDCRDLSLTTKDIRKIEEEIIQTLRDNFLSDPSKYPSEPLHISENKLVLALKIRAHYPNKNIGLSGALRVLVLLQQGDDKALDFHVISKIGTHRKDNLSDNEKNSVVKMVDDLSK